MFNTVGFIKVNGQDVKVIRVTNDVNGNPRFIFKKDGLEDKKVLLGAKQFRKRGFENFFVISSYCLRDDFKNAGLDFSTL